MLGISLSVGVASSGRVLPKQQYTFDGIDDLMSFPDSTLEIGDTASMDLTTLLSATNYSILNGITIVNGIITAPNFSITLDGLAYVGGVISDGAHSLVAITTAQVIVNQAGLYNGVIKNLSIDHLAPTVANPNLFYPIDDGWAANPTIRETLTDGSFPELVVNGGFDTDLSGWSSHSGTILEYETGSAKTTAVASQGFIKRLDLPIEVGKTYDCSIDIVNPSSPSFLINNVTDSAPLVLISGSTYVGRVAATGSNQAMYVKGNGTTGQVSLIDNVSVKETRQGAAVNFNEGGWDYE